MKKLKVNIPNNEYNILIGRDILKSADEYIKNAPFCEKTEKIMIVTDENVYEIYGEIVEKALSKICEVKTVVLPAGETTKSLDFLKRLYDEALDFNMTRADLAVALGGGVIGDLTGFFASTLYRGIGIVQIPTTLLSQVDSSVGGKTAIDVPQGKNLVGSFYQPDLVIIDADTLKTLPDKELSGGMAEVIKYGAIRDEALFEKLEKISGKDELLENIEDIIYTCCDIKRDIVEKDEHDLSLRMILNFGHTVGHIVEKAYNYTGYTHGEAVGFGMCVAAKIGETLTVTEKGTTERISKITSKYGLPQKITIDEKHLASAFLDKKASGKTISVILLNKIGECEIVKMLVTEFTEQTKGAI